MIKYKVSKNKVIQALPCVLVIDDDIQIVHALRKLLEGEGYEVTAASNGNDGLRVFRERQIDLVITDIIMPEKEGLETIMEFKREKPDLGIIAISGGGWLEADPYLVTAKRIGADRTLAKPMERKSLLAAVRELLCDVTI